MKSRVKSLFGRLRGLVHPENKLVVRQRISHKFIRGTGVEIGALHDPLWVSEAVKVRYVDIMTRDEASRIFPSLSNLVDPDIIDDGEILSTIEDNSLDFIIANHFLEHCINPLGTMRNHLAKLKRGGVLYYAVPNKDLTFDKEREITSFEHLIKDDKEGGEVSRWDHYLDYAKFVDNKVDPAEQVEQARRLEESDNRIHFHVWDAAATKDFFTRAIDYLDDSCVIKEMTAVDNEIICVICKSN